MSQPSVDRLEQIDQLLAPPGERVLVVADPVALDASGAGSRLKALIESPGAELFTDFSPNPSMLDAARAAETLAGCPEAQVVAIGGGAAIDTAKLACFAAATGPGRCRERPVEVIADAASTPGRAHRLIAVPTTAGAGSEATQFAVVYVDGVKHSLSHPALRPDTVVLDPTLTHSLPAAVTAASGLDAASQAIESLWNIHSTEESREHADAALQLAIANLQSAVNQPAPSSRAAMQTAAHLAGRAINRTRTTGPHALSYYLTIHHGVAHGFAVALSLAAFLRFNAAATSESTIDPRGVKAVRSTIEHIARRLGADGQGEALIEDATQRWTALLESVAAPTRLSEVGLTAATDRTAMAASVNVERIANNPRRLSPTDLRDLVESIA